MLFLCLSIKVRDPNFSCLNKTAFIFVDSVTLTSSVTAGRAAACPAGLRHGDEQRVLLALQACIINCDIVYYLFEMVKW